MSRLGFLERLVLWIDGGVPDQESPGERRARECNAPSLRRVGGDDALERDALENDVRLVWQQLRTTFRRARNEMFYGEVELARLRRPVSAGSWACSPVLWAAAVLLLVLVGPGVGRGQIGFWWNGLLRADSGPALAQAASCEQIPLPCVVHAASGAATSLELIGGAHLTLHRGSVELDAPTSWRAGSGPLLTDVSSGLAVVEVEAEGCTLKSRQSEFRLERGGDSDSILLSVLSGRLVVESDVARKVFEAGQRLSLEDGKVTPRDPEPSPIRSDPVIDEPSERVEVPPTAEVDHQPRDHEDSPNGPNPGSSESSDSPGAAHTESKDSGRTAFCGRLLHAGRPVANAQVVLLPCEVPDAARQDAARRTSTNLSRQLENLRWSAPPVQSPIQGASDAEGRFDLDAPAGGYLLAVVPSGGEAVAGLVDRFVELHDGETRFQVFELEAADRIRVRCEDIWGRPLVGASVGHGGKQVETDDRGLFSWSVPLQGVHGVGDFGTVLRLAEGCAPEARRLTVSTSHWPATAGRNVIVTLRDSFGIPVVDGWAEASAQIGGFWWSVREVADAEGVVDLRDLPAGEVWISVGSAEHQSESGLLDLSHQRVPLELRQTLQTGEQRTLSLEDANGALIHDGFVQAWVGERFIEAQPDLGGVWSFTTLESSTDLLAVAGAPGHGIVRLGSTSVDGAERVRLQPAEARRVAVCSGTEPARDVWALWLIVDREGRWLYAEALVRDPLSSEFVVPSFAANGDGELRAWLFVGSADGVGSESVLIADPGVTRWEVDLIEQSARHRDRGDPGRDNAGGAH